jgi:hypothetical protein
VRKIIQIHYGHAEDFTKVVVFLLWFYLVLFFLSISVEASAVFHMTEMENCCVRGKNRDDRVVSSTN